MTRAIKRQILLTATYLLLISVFLGGGLYLKQNPISWKTWKSGSDAELKTAYIHYDPTEVNTFDGDPSAGTTGVTLETAIPRFYTTARASVFTFSGIGSVEELKGVLKALKESGSTATFFVTVEDLSQKADQIHMIRDAGSGALTARYQGDQEYSVWYADGETLSVWRETLQTMGYQHFDVFRLGGNCYTSLSEFLKK